MKIAAISQAYASIVGKDAFMQRVTKVMQIITHKIKTPSYFHHLLNNR